MTTPHSTPPEQLKQRKMGIGMFILAWAALILMMGFFFDEQLSQQQNPNQQPLSTINASGIREVILQPNKQHHYVLNGFINGQAVVFLLDTGATDVVVPQRLARKIGLKAGRKSYARTANGTIAVFGTMLASVKLGDIELTDIRASINPAMDSNVVLLGMSALKQIEFSQRGDTLILRQ